MNGCVDFETVESRVTRDSAGDLSWSGYDHDDDENDSEQLRAAGLRFEILSSQGAILLREGPASDWKVVLPLPLREDSFTAFSAETERQIHVRVLEKSTLIAGEPAVLRVFRSEVELRRAMAELGAVLAFGLPFAAGLSAAGGYLIAYRSLSPMSQIAARARQITAESLGGRLPVPNPHDELGQLATVFNATLARLENSFAELRPFYGRCFARVAHPLNGSQGCG